MNDTSKTEIVREWVLLAAELAATVTTMYLAYKLIVGPDGQRILRMRIARGTSCFAKTQAEWWTTLAANADTYYHLQTV